jgi:predicted nucleic acid-binding Zn ribbon protein
MASDESIRCEECGQEFDTVDTLKEHQTSEREEKELRNKRLID